MGGARGNGASPKKVKPGSAARARTPRNGSSYLSCPYCHKPHIYHVLLQMHWDEDCEAAEGCGEIQQESLRSVEETQQPVEEPATASQNGEPEPAEEWREEVDWVKNFSLSRSGQILPSLDGGGHRFFDIQVGTHDQECELERSGQETQPEETMTVGKFRNSTGDASGDGENMVSTKEFQEISDSLATLRKEFQELLKDKEELVGKVGQLTVQKKEAQTVLEELLVETNRAYEELQADNNIREERYNQWRLELEGKLIEQEESTKLVQQNLDLLVKAKQELQDRLHVEELKRKNAEEDAELLRTERRRTQEELTSLRANLNFFLHRLQRHSIDPDNLMHDERLRNRKFLLERYEALMPGQTPLSSLVADMGDGESHRTEPSKKTEQKLDCLFEELKSWPKLPQQVDNLFAAVKKVAEQAGAPLLSCHQGCLEEHSLPCEGESPLSQCFFDGLEEPVARRSSGLPLHAVQFLTTLPVECLETEMPSTLSSHSSLTLPDKSRPREQVPSKVTLTRPLLELDTQKDSIQRDSRADTVASDLPGSQPGPPAQVSDASLPVSEHRVATGSPAVVIASPLNQIVTGPCDVNSGRSIYSLLGAFPPANGPGAVPQVLSTPAQDVTVGKTSLVGNNTKRYLNLEAASEKGSDMEQRLQHNAPAAVKSSDVSVGPELEIAGKANGDHPASSGGNDPGHEATGYESDREEHLLVTSARKGKGSGTRPSRRNQVVLSSDSECEKVWQRSTRRRMSFHSPLSDNKALEGSHQGQLEARLKDESASIVGIDRTPGKRKDHHSTLQGTGGPSSPFKRLKHLEPPSGEEKQTSPSVRRSRRRLRKRQEVESDSIHEEGSTDDEPVRVVTGGNASRQEKKVKKFVDLRKECDDDGEDEDEINEEWSSGDDGFINDEPLSDNCCGGSEDGSEAGDVSESSIMEVRPDRKALDWTFLGDMMAAFGKDDLLCMRAVCCLFRQQTQVEQALHIACNRNGVGFDMSGVKRGSELAVFLSAGDPDHKLTKSVEELKEKWPKGVEECKNLAFRHATQLFRIYKENLDPFPEG